MVEKSSIELIPKEVESARGKELLLRRLRVWGFGFFILSILISGGILTFSLVNATKLDSLKQESAKQIAQITQSADIESKVLGLSEKSVALTRILSQRDYFSIALATVEKSRPVGLRVKGNTLEAGKTSVVIDGETASYVNLAAFLQNLVSSTKGGVLFSGVALTSVNLNASKGAAEFVIEATMQKDGLKKSLTKEVAP